MSEPVLRFSDGTRARPDSSDASRHSCYGGPVTDQLWEVSALVGLIEAEKRRSETAV
jgi:hypothetical protein